MKKSRKIVLTLIASACIAASACDSDQKTQRNVYASKEACANDWSSTDYYGGRPWYFQSGNETPVETKPSQGAYNMKPGASSPHAVSSFSSSRTVRGGFGGSSSMQGGGS